MVAEKKSNGVAYGCLVKCQTRYFCWTVVGGVTVIADLAIVVILGVIASALMFAWQYAKQISVNSYLNEKGSKIYQLQGSLFFASIAAFQNLFTPSNDPDNVVIDFKHAKVVDHSALAAIDGLAVRYLTRVKGCI